jgi:hypothetical protein
MSSSLEFVVNLLRHYVDADGLAPKVYGKFIIEYFS